MHVVGPCTKEYPKNTHTNAHMPALVFSFVINRAALGSVGRSGGFKGWLKYASKHNPAHYSPALALESSLLLKFVLLYRSCKLSYQSLETSQYAGPKKFLRTDRDPDDLSLFPRSAALTFA